LRVAILDGDIFVWEAACRGEQKFQFGDDTAVSVDEAVALANFDRRVKTVMEFCKAKAVVVALSDPSRRYWRHDLLPTYKAGRIGYRPTCISAVRAHAESRYVCMVRPYLEADDVMGILATGKHLGKMLNAPKVEPIIVSTDKDMKQIPCLHLNPQKLEEGVFRVTREEGDRWHLTQTLIGDVCDNYTGCPGIGPVKAEKFVAKGWPGVMKAYKSKGLGLDDALRQARVARILQVEDWNAKTQTPHLWVPKEHR